MSGLPFASGQPGGERAPVADPRGCALLHLIRALAHDEAASLADYCGDRRINRELIAADPLAIAQHDTYLAAIHLIDCILGDQDLARPLAAKLAERFPA